MAAARTAALKNDLLVYTSLCAGLLLAQEQV